MVYREIPPPAVLAPYVRFFWTLENDLSLVPTAGERVFPDGCVELIVHYGDAYQSLDLDGSIRLQPRCFVHGQLTRCLHLVPTGRTGLIAVRFRPEGALAFLHRPLHEFTDQAVGLDDVFGRAGKELAETVVQARTESERLEILQKFLIDRLAASLQTDWVVAEGIGHLAVMQGQTDLCALRQRLNVSERQFERKFLHAVGMSPKLFNRVLRFQAVFQRAQLDPAATLTALSLESGYYDQAHFIRDFRAFTGLAPRAYFAEDRRFTELMLFGD
ncbi:MAG: AraC family transcriptional regulator [Sphingobacteriaceae bacterium]|nr:AraC family transcriptional regulator [Cytophagaceae bacterium]